MAATEPGDVLTGTSVHGALTEAWVMERPGARATLQGLAAPPLPRCASLGGRLRMGYITEDFARRNYGYRL